MSHFRCYLERVEEESPGISRSLEASITQFVRDHIQDFSYNEHMPGLLLGHVQSGKTAHILGTVASVADTQDFRLFILLTVDNVILHQQTIRRAFRTLDTINVIGETDSDRFLQGNLRRPTLIILKKNARVLENWQRYLALLEGFQYQPLFILDDEADAASLNTQVNRADISTIHRIITDIRTSAPSSIYLQVTATPQAPLLQTFDSGVRPSCVEWIEPGEGYLGGDFFYSENAACQQIVPTTEYAELINTDIIPEGLRNAVLSYLITGVARITLGAHETNLMLVHPSLRIADHQTTARKIQTFLSEIIDNIHPTDSFLNYALRDVYLDLATTVSDIPEFDAIQEAISSAVEATNIIVLNSDSSTDRDYSRGFNIVIGGNSLGRGVTFPALHTVYYSRQARTPQADTMWQHSRVFGYDRDPGYCRIFLPARLNNFFRELTEANNAIFSTLRTQGVDGITILSPLGTRPTRPAVLDQAALAIIVGGVNYFLNDPLHRSTPQLDELLGQDDSERHITLDDMLEILSFVEVEEDETETLEAFRSSIIALQSVGESSGLLIIRTARNVGRNTGTLLSPNDRLLAASIGDRTVLVMYRLNGLIDDGWDGHPVWVPNIKYPDGRSFFASDLI